LKGFLRSPTGAPASPAKPRWSAVKQLAQVLAYTEQNVNAAFDLAHKLVKASGPQEALALHGEYLIAQVEVSQTQAKQLGRDIAEERRTGFH
jgi:hypothetical protein